MPHAVLVGAHERDNFGDIACSAVTARVLAPLPVLRAGMLSSDMRALGGDLVVAAGTLHRSPNKAAACATIFFGGETLACDASCGLAMNFSDADAGRFLQMTPEMQARTLAMQKVGSLAYVFPVGDLLSHQSTDAPVIYHSVGGTAIPTLLRRSDIRRTLENNLKKASYVSVRDAQTRAILSEMCGIHAQLYPDSGFALRRVLGEDITDAADLGPVRAARAFGRYIVFQGNAQFLTSTGLAQAADRIAHIAEGMKTAVVLQPAGTAFAHDSMRQLAVLGALIEEARPRVRTYLQRNRHFLVQIAVIANAACWIGTSLHGRIAAIAMRVPAVNFENAKVKATVETWEHDPLPYEATWDQLPEAIRTALAFDHAQLDALACRLEETAMEGLNKVRTLAWSSVPRHRTRADDNLQQAMLASLVEENRILRAENLTLMTELASVPRRRAPTKVGSIRAQHEAPAQLLQPDLQHPDNTANPAEIETKLERQSTREPYLAALASLREAEIGSRDQTIELLKARLQAERDSFLNSTSWRVTAPLRSLKHLLCRKTTSRVAVK